MAAEHLQRGAAAETAALTLLQRAGLALLARNARSRAGELDLVMRDGDTLVFVEVRQRSSSAFGGALASLDGNKCRRVIRAARGWLAANPAYAQATCRFDVVLAHGHPPLLHWLRDAFRADDC